MLYVGRSTRRRTSRAQFVLRASLSKAWSAVTAKPDLDDPFIDAKVQDRVGKLIARACSCRGERITARRTADMTKDEG